MAALAGAIARIKIGRPLRPETDIGRRFLASPVMPGAGAVAGSATGGAAPTECAMHCIEHGMGSGIALAIVAIQTTWLILCP